MKQRRQARWQSAAVASGRDRREALRQQGAAAPELAPASPRRAAQAAAAGAPAAHTAGAASGEQQPASRAASSSRRTSPRACRRPTTSRKQRRALSQPRRDTDTPPELPLEELDPPVAARRRARRDERRRSAPDSSSRPTRSSPTCTWSAVQGWSRSAAPAARRSRRASTSTAPELDIAIVKTGSPIPISRRCRWAPRRAHAPGQEVIALGSAARPAEHRYARHRQRGARGRRADARADRRGDQSGQQRRPAARSHRPRHRHHHDGDEVSRRAGSVVRRSDRSCADVCSPASVPRTRAARRCRS